MGAELGLQRPWLQPRRSLTTPSHFLCCWACLLCIWRSKEHRLRSRAWSVPFFSSRVPAAVAREQGSACLLGGSRVGQSVGLSAVDIFGASVLSAWHRVTVHASGRPTDLLLGMGLRATFSEPGAWCLFTVCSGLLSQQGGVVPWSWHACAAGRLGPRARKATARPNCFISSCLTLSEALDSRWPACRLQSPGVVQLAKCASHFIPRFPVYGFAAGARRRAT